MKKLENYGVQTLNTKEIREIERGFLGTLVGALLAYAIIDAVENPDDFWDGVEYFI